MVNRFREERGQASTRTTPRRDRRDRGTTVLFSSLTVAVAMCGLFVFGVPILTSFGIAGLAVVLLACPPRSRCCPRRSPPSARGSRRRARADVEAASTG
jgi:hypothetical protein